MNYELPRFIEVTTIAPISENEHPTLIAMDQISGAFQCPVHSPHITRLETTLEQTGYPGQRKHSRADNPLADLMAALIPQDPSDLHVYADINQIAQAFSNADYPMLAFGHTVKGDHQDPELEFHHDRALIRPRSVNLVLEEPIGHTANINMPGDKQTDHEGAYRTDWEYADLCHWLDSHAEQPRPLCWYPRDSTRLVSAQTLYMQSNNKLAKATIRFPLNTLLMFVADKNAMHLNPEVKGMVKSYVGVMFLDHGNITVVDETLDQLKARMKGSPLIKANVLTEDGKCPCLVNPFVGSLVRHEPERNRTLMVTRGDRNILEFIDPTGQTYRDFARILNAVNVNPDFTPTFA